MKSLPLLLVLLLAGDEFAAGLRAYREGRFRDALEAFTAAERAAGEEASAALRYDKALAALRAGDLLAAESAAEQAAARGGPEFVAQRDFLLGNVAFARCEQAAAQAEAPEAEPFAFDAALALARSARDSWRRAARQRSDWPAARRNVERALLAIEDLERRKAAAQVRKDAPAPPRIEPLLAARTPAEPQRPDDPSEGSQAEAPSEPPPAELSPAEVLALFEKLQRKERDKLALRRAERRGRQVDVERDW